MKSFIDIRTVYKNDRTVESLSNIYNDLEFLKETIRDMIANHISKDKIIDKKILLKPNWVRHAIIETDKISLCTNENFILATVEVLLQNNPKSVLIGDAPIQGCNWSLLLSDQFYDNIKVLSKQYKIPISIKDFRRATFDHSLNNPQKERNPLSEYLIFDLGKESCLEPISSDKNIFRVTKYNPDRLAESHRKGIHKYCITKELFEADIVISLPKMKTHQKTGITGAVKNLVGLNGDKDYLPHHRIGGTSYGGDCYPGNNILRLWSEYLLDSANRRQGKWSYKLFSYSAAILWKLTKPQRIHSLAAGWHGNDTTWRMVLDLNKIAVYGKADGAISDNPQRNLYSLCDGIIGGQGNGPLSPTPLPLGVISFTNNSGLNDISIATIMGFDYKQIPLLANQKVDLNSSYTEIAIDGEKVSFERLKDFAVETIPPPGWVEYLK